MGKLATVRELVPTPEAEASVDSLLAYRDKLIEAYHELPTRISMVQQEINRRTQNPMTRLTQRQKEVLTYLRTGMSNKEIGWALHITERGVKFHVSRLLKKFGAQSREGLK